jgi:hypothetical protein
MAIPGCLPWRQVPSLPSEIPWLCGFRRGDNWSNRQRAEFVARSRAFKAATSVLLPKPGGFEGLASFKEYPEPPDDAVAECHLPRTLLHHGPAPVRASALDDSGENHIARRGKQREPENEAVLRAAAVETTLRLIAFIDQEEAEMAQTKAQRSAAAKKAAATRKRNAAKSSAKDAKSAARSTGKGVADVARAVGSTAKNAAESVVKRAGASTKGKKR